jgi:hypothetical protein
MAVTTVIQMDILKHVWGSYLDLERPFIIATKILKSFSWLPLKVPKREIFDRSDFPDFYTIKSLRVGDLGVKIKKNKKNI